MYEIVESSPKAKAKIAADFDESKAEPATTNDHHRVRYPFDALNVGMSFAVPMTEINELAIRNSASVRGRLTKKKFCIVKHAQFGVYEVARIG